MTNRPAVLRSGIPFSYLGSRSRRLSVRRPVIRSRVVRPIWGLYRLTGEGLSHAGPGSMAPSMPLLADIPGTARMDGAIHLIGGFLP